jgi:hypothetical protein
VDLVVTLHHGRAPEVGAYKELMAQDGAFAKLMQDYGGVGEEEAVVEAAVEEALEKVDDAKRVEKKVVRGGGGGSVKSSEQESLSALGPIYQTYLYPYIYLSVGPHTVRSIRRGMLRTAS